jgi:hypothetical protein
MPTGMALIPSFIMMAFPGPWHKVFFTFGLLLPLSALFRFFEKRTTESILTVGLTLGIALIFKIYSGLFSLLTISIVLFLLNILEKGNLTLSRKAIWNSIRELLLCSLALLSVITPVFLYYLSRSVLGKVFYSLKEGYGLSYSVSTTGFFGKPNLVKAVTKFHIGSLENFFFCLVILLYLHFSLKVLICLFSKKKQDFPLYLPVLIMGMFSLTYSINIFEKSHFLQSLSMAYILFGFLVYSVAKKKERATNVILMILFVLLGLYLLDNYKWRNYFYSGSIKRLYAIRKEGGGLISSNKAKICVGKKQSVKINNLLQYFEGKKGYLMPLFYAPMVNFLTGLENPTRFTILFPSIFRDPLKQKQVIGDVERYKIQYLLINKSIWKREDNLGISIYAPMVYEFVLKRYSLENEIGAYLIFSRRY